MKLLDKKIDMPFKSDEDYVAKIVEKYTEQAIDSAESKQNESNWKIAIAVAIFVLLGIAFAQLFPKIRAMQMAEDNQLDAFLNNISDSDAVHITCYYIEEIPEY